MFVKICGMTRQADLDCAREAGCAMAGFIFAGKSPRRIAPAAAARLAAGGMLRVGVFTQDELNIATESSNPPLAIIRFWCAKEAVSKALGTGIRYSPRELNVTGYRAETGQLVVRLNGGWVQAFKNFKGRDIEVSTRVLRDHALAFCLIPAALFADAND